jgi:3-hydroxyisobutyrate dehydrogenase-like beta-hydroxyacid dehydrogenase
LVRELPVGLRRNSQDTIERARNAKVEVLNSDLELVNQCRLILSVVPPKDAERTAQRVIDALSGGSKTEDVYFADLNAVAPSTCRDIAATIEKARVPVRFIDGCIIGGPPRLKSAPDPGTNQTASDDSHAEWNRPRLPISGPHSLSDLPGGERIAVILNSRLISPAIGAASGLKMCFAAMTKGYTAIATQSFTTAHSLGVADELRTEMAELIPRQLQTAEGSVPSMVPKAYRWVREMEEIAKTMAEDGGWTKSLFTGAAEIYSEVASDMTLKEEKAGKRKRGTTVEEVAGIMSEGLQKKKKKTV